MPVVERECVVCYCMKRDHKPEHSLLTVLLTQASGRSYDSIYRELCFSHRRTIDRGMQLAEKLDFTMLGTHTT